MNPIHRKVATLSLKITMTFSLAALAACGQGPTANDSIAVNTGIVGGEEAVGSEPFAKHVVGLYDSKIGAVCTASILSKTIVVTAAHCVESEPSALRVVFAKNLDAQDAIFRQVEDHRVSPIWAFRQNQELNTGDIAVVKFAGGLPAGYEPIGFLTDASKLSTNMDVLLAGFGASEVVQVRDERTGGLVADHLGANILRFATTSIKDAKFTKSEFSTESSKGKGACHGDSGGPAYVEVEVERGGAKVKEFVLAGVTSRSAGDDADLCNVSAVYTSIPFYATWIVSTAKMLNDLPAATRPVRTTAAAGN